MTQKPTLYWTLIRDFGRLWKPMRVTSVKGLRMVYGADEDGMSTHRRTGETRGRFDTIDAARSVIGELHENERRFNELRRPPTNAIAALNRQQQEAELEIIRKAGSR